MNGWEFVISYVFVGFCCAVATAIIADDQDEVGKPPWLFAIACAWPFFMFLLVAVLSMVVLRCVVDGFNVLVRTTAAWARRSFLP